MSEKMFTQDEVNAIVQKRLAEERTRLSNDVDNEYKAQCEEMKAQFNAFAMKAAKKELFFTLQANKAIEPEDMAQLLSGHLKVDEQGNAVFMNADQKEISIQDGVSEYLNARPWAIRKVTIDGLRPGESNLPEGWDDAAAIRAAMQL